MIVNLQQLQLAWQLFGPDIIFWHMPFWQGLIAQELHWATGAQVVVCTLNKIKMTTHTIKEIK